MKPFNEAGEVQDATQMQVGQFFFHGDVLVTRVNALPTDLTLKQKSNNILAYGEVTGHVHELIADTDDSVMVLEADESTDDNPLMFFEVKPEEKVVLKHQEHRGIKVGPGFYKVGVQREFDHLQKISQKVKD